MIITDKIKAHFGTGRAVKGYLSVCFLLLSSLFIGCKTAELSDLTRAINQTSAPLDNKTVIAGLKQALQIGARNSVSKTSKKGGFNNNPLIHIPLPKELDSAVSALNKVGLGRYSKKLELQMNRAAEVASVEAKDILIKSVSNMSLQDGWSILKGGDNAATNYFRRNTQNELKVKFQPVIKRSMNKIGFYPEYRKLLKAYNTIPFTRKPNLDIENYIMNKSLDGLFIMLAKEEAKIRKDPAARVTELLKKVFTAG